MRKFAFTAMAVFVSASTFAQTVSTFENLPLEPDSFWNGSDLSGGFVNGNTFFRNDYDATFQTWSGFAYSNIKDSTTSGFGNQYSAITASGFSGSSNYAVAMDYDNVTASFSPFAEQTYVEGFYVTNNTYAYLSMRDGDLFAKKFGGVDGNEPDWFKLTVNGWLNGVQKEQEVEFYLADFRFSDNSQDYIVRDWQWVNLLPLGPVDSIRFSLSSSDVGSWGMNTPGYFCIDNFTTLELHNLAPVANDLSFSIRYDQDTLIELPVTDETFLPYTITLLSEPKIFGATASIDEATNKLYYSPAIGIVSNDTLIYKVTDLEGLSDTAMIYIKVTGVTGIDNETLSAIAVYPNPFSTQLQVNGITQKTALQLFSISGALLKTETLTTDETLNVSELPSGVYVLRLQSGSAVSNTRIIKQ